MNREDAMYQGLIAKESDDWPDYDTAVLREAQELVRENKALRTALKQANRAMRGLFGDGPISGLGKLDDRLEAIRLAAVEAARVLCRK